MQSFGFQKQFVIQFLHMKLENMWYEKVLNNNKIL